MSASRPVRGRLAPSPTGFLHLGNAWAFLLAWLVLTVEVDLVMFGRTAPAYAYLLAAALTALFSVIVNIAAHVRLKKVDMVESLKTVE